MLSQTIFVTFFVSAVFSANCEWKDIGVAYGICREGVRNVVFYWLDACTPGDGTTGRGEKLPARQYNISCDKGCNFNEFYNVDTKLCQVCAGGTYPADAQLGYVYVNDTLFSRDFVSISNGYGVPWNTINGQITSGKQPPNADVNLTLKEVNIVAANGNVTFSYMGFGNPRQTSFSFYVDGELRRPENATYGNGLPLDTTWHWATFNLTFGVHNLTWRITTQANMNASLIENIHIRLITVTGTRYLPLYCTPCPPGTYDSEDTPTCQACGFNTFSNQSGSTSCQSCGADSYAEDGWTACKPRIPCVQNFDFVPHYGPCVNGQQEVSYVKIEPSTCNTAGPANFNVSCDLCNPGEYRNSARNCVPCPSGQYRDFNSTDDSACLLCPAETSAFRATFVRHLDFVNNSNRTGGVAGNFSTSCESNVLGVDYCGDSPFWKSHGNYIHTGDYSGPVRSTLLLNFSGDSDAGSSIEFQVTPHLAADSVFFYSPGFFAPPVVINSSSNDVKINVTVNTMNAGNFTWTFFKRGPGVEQNGSRIHDYVEISYITLQGINEATGGATKCVICPNGTESREGSDTCTNCSAGTYSFNGTACKSCTGNTITENNRSMFCEPCGQGSTAQANNTRCEVTTCGFRLNDTFSFDLTGLTNADLPAFNISVPQTVSVHYYGVCKYSTASVCKTNSENDTGTSVLACEVSTNGRNMNTIGNKTNITYFENQTSGDYGVNITYYNSVFFGGGGGPGGGPPGFNFRSAELLLRCVPNAGTGRIYEAEVFQDNSTSSPQRYHFIWETEFGCRLCQREDYEEFTTECVKPGKRTVTLVQKPTVKCSRGFVPGDPSEEKCKRPAATMSGGALAGLVLAGIGVVTAVVVVLVLLVRKNRALSHQLLQKDNFTLGGAQGGQGASGMVSLGQGGTKM